MCPRGPLAMSGEVCGCHGGGKKVLLASSGESPGMLLNPHNVQDRPYPKCQVSVVSKWRGPGLGQYWRSVHPDL